MFILVLHDSNPNAQFFLKNNLSDFREVETIFKKNNYSRSKSVFSLILFLRFFGEVEFGPARLQS